MADIIARWRNPSPKTLVELVSELPHEDMASVDFREYMKGSSIKDFFTTAYQVACQMGLYYEVDGEYHPRFTRNISEEEAEAYLEKWVHKYSAPNPYTKSLKTLQTPVLLVKSIVDYIEKYGEANLEEILQSVFGDPMGNLDIVSNILNNYSHVVNVRTEKTSLSEDKKNVRIASLEENYKEYMEQYLDRTDKKAFYHSLDDAPKVSTVSQEQIISKKQSYLAAIRTKPFLLLAGISGTGKSRIVKELAYSCCPNVGDLQSDPTSPGNYCLVEVKPNWNDSTELLGYETVLEGGGYHLTKFVKFVIKAMQHKDVPFFVCLDEMNLAPVEQYFAEFLSVLESRKDVEVDGERTIQSEPLIEASIFEKYKNKLFAELFLTKDETKGKEQYIVDEESPVYINSTYAQLKKEGLRIPRNLIVVGTVNMDDTTYQFSRKVIDRAMTIEMNEVNLDNMFDMNKADALSYNEDVVDKSWFFAPFAQSNKTLPVIDEAERTQLVTKIKETIGQTVDGAATPGSLEEILGKTPFRIAYRVVNELILHFYALRWQNEEADFGTLYNDALDNILMMKVLPRIEGNEDLVGEPLRKLEEWTANTYPKSCQKVKEMNGRLKNHFTSFWP